MNKKKLAKAKVPLWKKKKCLINQVLNNTVVKEKSISELKSRLENQEDFILLDVRTDNEVLVSKITEDFIHIPMNEIPQSYLKSIIIKKL